MFERLWEMSIQASILILVVLVVRQVIKRMPKGYSYILWLLVVFRLLCPVFVESSISLQPQVLTYGTGKEVRAENGMEPEQVAGLEHEIVNRGENPVEMGNQKSEKAVQNETVQREPVQAETMQPIGTPPVANGDAGQKMEITAKSFRMEEAVSIVWGAGIFVMFGIHLWQYGKMRRRVKMAVREKDNVWLCDRVESPFVMGVIKPRIYLPFGLKEEEKQYVLWHEQTHIKHRDPFVRILGVAALCLHWWNPLVWVAIRLMNRDMEMFCDEAALKGADVTERKAYLEALLQFAIRRSYPSVTLGFGESDTEKRVKNIMFWKRPGVLVCIGVVAGILLCTVCFLTVPKSRENSGDTTTGDEMVSDSTYVITAGEFDQGVRWVRETGGYEDDTAYYAFVHDFDKDGKEEAFIAIGSEVHAIPTRDSEMMIFGDLWYTSGTGKPKMLVSDMKVGASQQLLSFEDDYILITYYKDFEWTTDMYLIQENQVSECFDGEQYPSVTLKYLENGELIMTWSFTDEVFRELADDFAGETTKEYPYVRKGNSFEVVSAREMTEQDFVDAGGSKELLNQIKTDYNADYLQFLRRENGIWHVNIGDDVGYNYEFYYVTYKEMEGTLVETDAGKGYYRMNPLSETGDFCELVRITRTENRVTEGKEDFWNRGRWFGRSEESIQKCYDVLLQKDVCEQNKYEVSDYYIMDIDGNMEDDYLVMLGIDDRSYEYTAGDYDDCGRFLIFMNGEQVYCYNDMDYSFTCRYGFMMDFCTDFDNDGYKELFLEAINGGNGGNDIMVLKYKDGIFEQMPIFTYNVDDMMPDMNITVCAGERADEYEIYCADMNEHIILKGQRLSAEEIGRTYEPGEECGWAGDYHLPDVVVYDEGNALLIRKMLKGEGGNVHYIGDACFVIAWTGNESLKVVDWWVEDPEGIKFTSD